MRKERLEKNIKMLKRNIEYYKKVYGPNLSKIKDLEEKLAQMVKMLGGTK